MSRDEIRAYVFAHYAKEQVVYSDGEDAQWVDLVVNEEQIDFKEVLLCVAWRGLTIPLTLLNLVMFVLLWTGAVLICMALIILSSTFGFIAYCPAGYFFGKQGSAAILTYLSPVIGACFFWISCKIWELFAERYAGTGS